MISYIYIIKNKVTNKTYVGFTINPRRRFLQHKRSKKNLPLYNAISKYSIENFVFEIIYASKDVNHCLTIMEPYFIKKYNTICPDGYNLSAGGTGTFGYHHREESRKKMSMWQIGRKLSKEHKKNIGLAHTPEMGNLGKKWSIEQRKKFMISRSWYKHHSHKTIKKIKDHHNTKEYKNKISKIVSDRWKNQEKRKIQSKKHCKCLYEVIFPDGNIIIINNLKRFAKENNLQATNLYAVVNGRKKHHKNFTCKRILEGRK